MDHVEHTDEVYKEFVAILGKAAKEVEEYMSCPWEPQPHSSPPYFLMMLEHPGYYLGLGSPYNSTLLHCLQDPDRTNLEKRLFILAMHQLGSSEQYGGHMDTAYRDLIKRACWCYRAGTLLLPLLEGLLCSPFPDISKNYPQYPLCILDYSLGYNQAALLHGMLDELIALPTIPCGLKEMAQKIKKGKLATAQEMKYMAGYREFRKTHFTLYETIEPRKK